MVPVDASIRIALGALMVKGSFVSVFSGVVGLVLSYYTNVATGPMIVIIASIIFFSTYLFGRRQ